MHTEELVTSTRALKVLQKRRLTRVALRPQRHGEAHRRVGICRLVHKCTDCCRSDQRTWHTLESIPRTRGSSCGVAMALGNFVKQPPVQSRLDQFREPSNKAVLGVSGFVPAITGGADPSPCLLACLLLH